MHMAFRETKDGKLIVPIGAIGARGIGMVFQSYALYPHMTVRDNLAFGLRLRKTDAATIASRVAEAAAVLGLEPLLDRYPRALSGGQRQRVAMGRAIVRRSGLFLFDEPLSNLDPALRTQVRVDISLPPSSAMILVPQGDVVALD